MTYSRLDEPYAVDDENGGSPSSKGPCGTRRSRQLTLGAIVAVVFVTIVGVGVGLHVHNEYSPPAVNASDNACLLQCTGPVLRAVQLAPIFNDSKTFVDMPVLGNPQAILDAFAAVDPANVAEVRAFVQEHFGSVSSDIEEWTPLDWTPTPGLIATIADETYAQFATDVVALWKQLGRRATQAVYDTPEQFTLIPTANPMIVPGGRFREVYYWDTYWIVQGLLASDMVHTAIGVVDNLLQFVRDYGFVPNGSRRYYLDRSQPPMLTLMVALIFEVTQSTRYLAQSLPVLEREYAYWMDTQAVEVVPLNRTSTQTFTLNRYARNTTEPRPESYREDVTTHGESRAPFKQNIYANLASGAETGWDYSSRWFQNRESLTEIVTSDVIPVDLNAILFRVETTLAQMSATVSQSDKAAQYNAAAERRRNAIHAVLWNPQLNQWTDFNVALRVRAPAGYVSNFLPLWAHAWASTVNVSSVVETFRTSGLVLPGGLTTSLFATGQQWDFPNAWAPLQQMMIQGLRELDSSNSTELARSLASTWVAANYLAYNATGFMHEKLNASVLGGVGSGGEYNPQIGFGWSNGVVLHLLQQYPDLSLPSNPTPNHS